MDKKRARQRQALKAKPRLVHYIIIYALKAFCYLPLTWQLKAGRTCVALGIRLYNHTIRHNPKKRPIGWLTRINLKQAFPEWSKERLEHETQKTGTRLGEMIIHIINAWFGRDQKHETLRDIDNFHANNTALAEGKGFLLLAWHDARTELVLKKIHRKWPITIFFNPSTNPLLNTLVIEGRKAFSHQQIALLNVKALLTALKQNQTLTYLIDQGRMRPGSIKVRMFNQDFYVDPLLPRLVNTYGAQIIMLTLTTGIDPSPISLKLFEKPEPEMSDERLCQYLVNHLAEQIRINYRHYLWEAKIFKRPDDSVDMYRWPPQSASPDRNK